MPSDRQHIFGQTFAEESLRSMRLRDSDRDSLAIYLDILPGVRRHVAPRPVVADVMSGDRALPVKLGELLQVMLRAE
jgi:hypothetical protein